MPKSEVKPMRYEVRITAKQVITVPVEAESMAQAKMIAQSKWHNSEYDQDSTHSRLQRNSVNFESLYPDLTQAR